MDSSTSFQDPTISERPIFLSHRIGEICGGFLGCEAKKVWLFSEDYLCAFDANSGKCIQRWRCNYGKIKKIYEVTFDTTHYLVVICSKLNDNDVITLLNTSSLTVVKSVKFCEKITNVCSWDYVMSSNAILKKFCGTLVIGCFGGRVYLLNLKLNQLFVVHQPLPTVVIVNGNSVDCYSMEHESLEILEGT